MKFFLLRMRLHIFILLVISGALSLITASPTRHITSAALLRFGKLVYDRDIDIEANGSKKRLYKKLNVYTLKMQQWARRQQDTMKMVKSKECEVPLDYTHGSVEKACLLTTATGCCLLNPIVWCCGYAADLCVTPCVKVAEETDQMEWMPVIVVDQVAFVTVRNTLIEWIAFAKKYTLNGALNRIHNIADKFLKVFNHQDGHLSLTATLLVGKENMKSTSKYNTETYNVIYDHYLAIISNIKFETFSE